MERGQRCFASSMPRAWMWIFIQRKQWNSYWDWAQRTKPVRDWALEGVTTTFRSILVTKLGDAFWEHRKLDSQCFSSPSGSFQAYQLLPVLPYLLLTSLPVFTSLGFPKDWKLLLIKCNVSQNMKEHDICRQQVTSDTQGPTTAAMQRPKQNYSLPSGKGCQSCLTSSDLDRPRSKKSGSLAPWAHAGTTKQWSQRTRTPHP